MQISHCCVKRFSSKVWINFSITNTMYNMLKRLLQIAIFRPILIHKYKIFESSAELLQSSEERSEFPRYFAVLRIQTVLQFFFEKIVLKNPNVHLCSTQLLDPCICMYWPFYNSDLLLLLLFWIGLFKHGPT